MQIVNLLGFGVLYLIKLTLTYGWGLTIILSDSKRKFFERWEKLTRFINIFFIIKIEVRQYIAKERVTELFGLFFFYIVISRKSKLYWRPRKNLLIIIVKKNIIFVVSIKFCFIADDWAQIHSMQNFFCFTWFPTRTRICGRYELLLSSVDI